METHGEQARVRRCGRALRRFLITASAIVILIIALTTWLGGNMREAMAALASARIRAVSAKAMNDAILDTMESNSAIPPCCIYAKTAPRYTWCRPIRSK